MNKKRILVSILIALPFFLFGDGIYSLYLDDVYGIDNDHAFVLLHTSERVMSESMERPFILYTKNSGKTWNTINLGILNDIYEIDNYVPWYHITSMKFVNNRQGYIWGYVSGNSDEYFGFLIYTDDGGLSWHKSLFGKNEMELQYLTNIRGVFFKDDAKGILLADRYNYYIPLKEPDYGSDKIVWIYMTEDGGVSWTLHSTVHFYTEIDMEKETAKYSIGYDKLNIRDDFWAWRSVEDDPWGFDVFHTVNGKKDQAVLKIRKDNYRMLLHLIP